MRQTPHGIPQGLECVSELDQAHAMMMELEEAASAAKRQIFALRLARLFLREPELSYILWEINRTGEAALTRCSFHDGIKKTPTWANSPLADFNLDGEKRRLLLKVAVVENEVGRLPRELCSEDGEPGDEMCCERFKPGENPVESAMRQMLTEAEFARWQAQTLLPEEDPASPGACKKSAPKSAL